MFDLLPADPVKRGRIKLLALAAFFALPVLAGYVAYFFDLAPGSASNYGTLLTPRPVPDVMLRGADQRPLRFSELRGKWLIVQFDSGACDSYCERKLYFMRQVRKALGKNMTRVERVWMLTDQQSPKAALLGAIDGTHLILPAGSAFSDVFSAERSTTDHIYLVDPQGNLMMRFPREPDPSKMLKDLKRLIKVSQVG